MGQELSSHELFLNGLKDSLKARRIKAKKKDLRSFFSFLADVCPWFPQEGTIDQKCWRRVGDCLNDYYRTFGPSKVPVSTFSYWNLINDILQIHSQDSDIKHIIQTGEAALKASSRPPSACHSVTISMPEEPNNSNIEPLKETLKKVPKLYPPLTSSPPHDDQLPPEDQEVLDDQAAHYHDEEDPWRLTAPVLHPLPSAPHNPPLITSLNHFHRLKTFYALRPRHVLQMTPRHK